MSGKLREIETIPEAACVSAITAGIPLPPLWALIYASYDEHAEALGRPLPEDALRIAAGTSLPDVLRGFDEVARDLRETFERTGDWAEALTDYLQRHHVASRRIERSLRLLAFFEHGWSNSGGRVH